jgi:hypothetical protein
MKTRTLALAACLTLAAAAPDARAALVSITAASLLGDALSSGFGACVDGPFSAACTGLPIASITLIGASDNTLNDVLDSGIDGNALVIRNSVPTISAPNGDMDGFDGQGGFLVTLSGTATQFGFRLVDEASVSIRVETSAGDFLTFTEGQGWPQPVRYFQSSTAISFFSVRCGQSACGGFGLDDLTLAGLAGSGNGDGDGTVPEPATLVLLALGLAGLGLSRRRSTPGAL